MIEQSSAGALMIRVWIDDGRLKARLIQLAQGETETDVVVGREAVIAAVERWLEQLPVTPR